jgi:hypothetical protein
MKRTSATERATFATAQATIPSLPGTTGIHSSLREAVRFMRGERVMIRGRFPSSKDRIAWKRRGSPGERKSPPKFKTVGACPKPGSKGKTPNISRFEARAFGS